MAWVQRGRRPFGDVCTKQLSDNDEAEGRNWQGRETERGGMGLSHSANRALLWSVGPLVPCFLGCPEL